MPKFRLISRKHIGNINFKKGGKERTTKTRTNIDTKQSRKPKPENLSQKKRRTNDVKNHLYFVIVVCKGLQRFPKVENC